jgi:hypothetical protein
VDESDEKQITGLQHLHSTGEATRVCPSCGLKLPFDSEVCPNDGTKLGDVLAAGTLFAGKYELLSVVGSGGMGIVYKARQVMLDKQVAVKTVLSAMPSDHAIRRFQQEGKAASRLSHPNVISIFDFGISANGKPYLVMDWVEGSTLADRIKMQGAVPLQECLDIFIQVIAGLSHAHAQGVLHRDLKPSNIMLAMSPSGTVQVKIVDFGIAKLVELEGRTNAGLTQTGELIGSPLYMSPQQGQGVNVDARSDLYSFGCVMYEALAGTPPIVRESVVATLLAHQQDKPLPLKQASLGLEFPDALERVIAKLLAKDPNERYQSADQVQQELLAIKSGGRSLTVENVEDAARKAMPRWIAYAVAATVATILVAAAYIGRTAFVKASNASTATTVVHDAKAVQSAKQDQDIVSLDEKDIANEIQDEVNRDPEEAHFKLRYFRATDETLAPLARLWRLRSVDLSCSKIGDNGLAYIEKCPLEILILAETQVTDAGMVHVANMKRLESLDLYDTKVSNSGLAHLAGVTSLHVLKIGGTQITGDGLENLLPLKSLKELDVNDLKNSMTEEGLATISKFANLTQLNLGGDRVTATGIAALANLPKLGNLSLARTNLSAGEIDALAKLKHLEVLDVEASSVTIKDLNTLAKELPSLEQLCIENCEKISQSDRQQFVKKHPRIQFVAPQILPDLQKAENLFFPNRTSKQAK